MEPEPLTHCEGEPPPPELLTGCSPELGPFTPWSRADSVGGQGGGSCHLLLHLPDLLQAGRLLLLQLLLLPLQALCHLDGSEGQASGQLRQAIRVGIQLQSQLTSYNT